MIQYQTYLALAGVIGGGFLLTLIVRHWSTVRNGVTWVALTSCCWMLVIGYSQYTGKITQFASAGYQVQGIKDQPPILEANATYDPQVVRAHEYSPEQVARVATGTYAQGE